MGDSAVGDVVNRRRERALESGICAGGCGAELSTDRQNAGEEMCADCQPEMAVDAAPKANPGGIVN